MQYNPGTANQQHTGVKGLGLFVTVTAQCVQPYVIQMFHFCASTTLEWTCLILPGSSMPVKSVNLLS